MSYKLLADIVTIFHTFLIIFILAGILFSLKFRWFRPVESFLLLTAIVIWSIFSGCPLTLLENYLRSYTNNPIPLTSIGFIPYYLYHWFGFHFSDLQITMATYFIALLFFFIDIEWFLPSAKKYLVKHKFVK